MKAVIERTTEFELGICPDFYRAGHAVYDLATNSFRLLDLWSLIYFDYEADVEFDDVIIRVKPGYVALLPPGVKKIYKFEGPSPHYTIHFRAKSGVDMAGGGQGIELPWLVDTSEQCHEFLDAFKEILGNGPIHPARAQMRLWELLFRLSDVPSYRSGEGGVIHPAVRTVMRIIEGRLADPLQVSWLAEQVQLSPNHLSTLFRQNLGRTVLAYIRERRVDQARHLLVHTDKRIKEIAVEVGMADLQYFNKSIRKAFGVSPRALRGEER